MLPELDRKLLTAFVDGELSSRQLRHALKLLRRSAEARILLSQLEKQARALHELPRVRSHPELSDSVLLEIQKRRLAPSRRTLPPPRSFVSVWGGYAAAAAILLVVCGASYVFFANQIESPDNVIAKGDEKTPPKRVGEKHLDSPKEITLAHGPATPEILAMAPQQDQPIEPIRVTQSNEKVVPRKPDAVVVPEQPKDMSSLITAPATEMVELKMVDIAAPTILKLQDVEQAKSREAFVAELNKAGGFRMELPCRTGTRALERLQVACKAQDIILHLDFTAAERMKLPHLRTNYAVYMEDVTPEELTRFLQTLAGEDRKADTKKNENQFDRVVAVRLNKQDRKELAELMGSDPTAAWPTGPLGTDLHKPVSEQTSSQITAALAGQGGTKPSGKKLEHQALVVPITPVHAAANSSEIKRYFDSRKPPRAGTLQLYLVIRETGA
jgi:hypothetical protein